MKTLNNFLYSPAGFWVALALIAVLAGVAGTLDATP